MALTPGTRLGVYEVSAKIGEGGMGEVYRARDTTLDRDVALKVLPAAFTEDLDRLSRFEREAKVLASLNHPNIGAIYGLENTDDGVSRALVLELIDGQTLADRIAQGPVPLDDALAIASQIAEALEEAHEQGIIHRDLKPANIKVRDDGMVKVLDFGLAKAFGPEAPSGAAGASLSPTISLTAAATQMGMVIGTAAYMAPEQARGKAIDKRADVWSFGAVLFEMLSGQRPFAGEDVSETLARVIDREPDWALLPDTVPPAVSNLVRRCLQKAPRKRVRDIGDVRLAMEGAFETRVPPSDTPSEAPPLRAWQRPVPAVLAALAACGLGAVAVWASLGSRDEPVPRTQRFTLTLPEAEQPRYNGNILSLAPDGQTLVYQASTNAPTQLFRRPLDQFEATPMPGTERGRWPFFSPDGEWVGLVASSTLLKIPLAGGPAQTLTTLPSRFGGADWGPDGMIVYGLYAPRGPLMRIPAAGGEATPLFTPDGQRRSTFPQVLPGGDAVIFTVSDAAPTNPSELRLLMVSTGDHRTLIPDAAHGRVLDTGHLVFVRGGALWAVRFDRERLDIVGTPVPVVEGIHVGNAENTPQYALSDNGSLAYVPSRADSQSRSLVWVDRNGEEEPLAVRAGDYSTLGLSPDGTRAALGLRDDSGNDDVWVSELARGTLTRLTTDDAFDGNPLWSPDGRRVVFSSDRNGRPELFWRAADGSGSAELLLTIDESVTGLTAYGWSPDGTTLFVQTGFPGTSIDVGMVSMQGPGAWEPLVQTVANESAPAISPDGRWLAYASDQTGRFEVYVRRFPELEDRRQISVGGGIRPSWSADGRELLYLGSSGGTPETVMRVPLDMTDGNPPSLVVGRPEHLVDWRYFSRPGARRQHDLSPDGQRILVISSGDAEGEGAQRAEINVILNWFEELKTRVPVD